MAAWITFIVSVVLLLPSTGSAQTINACVSKNGSIRIVTDGAPCPRQDTPLQWNSGLRVYDADDVEIGPLMSIAAVTFFIDGKGYSAAVGPNGWVESQSSFYFFNDACSGDRYVLRAVSSYAPPALPEYFFTSLQVIGTTGYYQDGSLVDLTLDPEVVSVWRWDVPSASCVPFYGNGRYWFGGHATITLPAHPAPFTIR
jgi:hypothetical protein